MIMPVILLTQQVTVALYSDLIFQIRLIIDENIVDWKYNYNIIDDRIYSDEYSDDSTKGKHFNELFNLSYQNPKDFNLSFFYDCKTQKVLVYITVISTPQYKQDLFESYIK